MLSAPASRCSVVSISASLSAVSTGCWSAAEGVTEEAPAWDASVGWSLSFFRIEFLSLKCVIELLPRAINHCLALAIDGHFALAINAPGAFTRARTVVE